MFQLIKIVGHIYFLNKFISLFIFIHFCIFINKQLFMTTLLIILAVIAIGFTVYKLESKSKKVEVPQAPEKIEPTPTPIVAAKKTAKKSAGAAKNTANRKTKL